MLLRACAASVNEPICDDGEGKRNGPTREPSTMVGNGRAAQGPKPLLKRRGRQGSSRLIASPASCVPKGAGYPLEPLRGPDGEDAAPRLIRCGEEKHLGSAVSGEQFRCRGLRHRHLDEPPIRQPGDGPRAAVSEDGRPEGANLAPEHQSSACSWPRRWSAWSRWGRCRAGSLRSAATRRPPPSPVVGWLGVATMGILWPLALIWAFLKPTAAGPPLSAPQSAPYERSAGKEGTSGT
jgi:hypothetical protein